MLLNEKNNNNWQVFPFWFLKSSIEYGFVKQKIRPDSVTNFYISER
jgi:hypothetical protein